MTTQPPPAAPADTESMRSGESTLRLPVELSSFVGRERELAAAQERFRSARLLTFTGTGGSGKTRLALELVTREARDFDADVIWVSLAPVESAASVCDAVSLALGVQPHSGNSGMNALISVLRDRRALVVLDNCEHVIDACAALVDGLLRACRELRVLATSREALGVAGETAWLVPPLSLPVPHAIAQSEAVQLFVERAHSVVPTFALTEANADPIAQICRRLDGLPLALELAAARLRSLPLEHFAERLDDCFRVLTTRNRTAAPRHQTLRAAIGWSYELLSRTEQRFLARLAIFAGSFSLEAAEAVCAGEGIEPQNVLDLVASLVEKSLLTLVESPDEARYRLLETIRQFAMEQLAAHDDDINLCRDRHTRFFTELAAEAAPHLTTAQRRPWTARVQEDLDNLRAALAWTYEHEPSLHLRLLGSLGWFWYSAGLWAEGRQRSNAALALPAAQAPSLERAHTLFGAGALACLQGDPGTALPWLRESAALAHSFADAKLEAYALNYIGMAFGQVADPQCVAPAETALAWARRTGDLYAARLALLILGTYELRIGNHARAESLTLEAVAAARSFGVDRELGISLSCLANASIANRDMVQAARIAREALQVFRHDPQYMFVARSLEILAGIACRAGDSLEGARLLGAGMAVRQFIAAKPFEADAEWIATHTRIARTAIGDDSFDRAWEEGRAMTMTHAIDYALSLNPVPAENSRLGRTTHSAVTEKYAEDSPNPPPELRVCALGALMIERDGSPAPSVLLRHAKVRELLLFLLIHPAGRTREDIGLALWPDATDAQVRNNFHVTLHQLRKSLGGAHWVRLERGLYRLGPESRVEFDVGAFERKMTAALRLAQRDGDAIREFKDALALYRGDFLAHESAAEWMIESGERLRNLYVEGQSAMGDALLNSGRHAEAVEIIEALCRASPTDESACQRLMTALSHLDRTADALRCYERLRKALKQDLGVEPSVATLKLLRALQRREA